MKYRKFTVELTTASQKIIDTWRFRPMTKREMKDRQAAIDEPPRQLTEIDDLSLAILAMDAFKKMAVYDYGFDRGVAMSLGGNFGVVEFPQYDPQLVALEMARRLWDQGHEKEIQKQKGNDMGQNESRGGGD